jgi:stringent starvation protein B
MSTPTRLPPKKDVALALLESSSVFIHLDPRSEEVRVPPWFKKQPQLVLNVGLNMPVPIPDLNVDEDAVSCTLSFSRSPYYCFVPWTAVYALVGEDGRGMVWPDDVPPEVAAQLPGAPQKKPAQRAHLRSVPPPNGASAAPAPTDAEPSAAGTPEVRRRRTRKKPQAKPALPQAARAEKPRLAPVTAPVERRPALQLASPSEVDGSEDRPTHREEKSKRKRELPPYLRVIK